MFRASLSTIYTQSDHIIYQIYQIRHSTWLRSAANIFRCLRTNARNENRLLREHLKCIKAILGGDWDRCRCAEEKPMDKPKLVDCAEENTKVLHATAMFSAEKIIPVILEEEDINR